MNKAMCLQSVNDPNFTIGLIFFIKKENCHIFLVIQHVKH